jgi:hypothetical protein
MVPFEVEISGLKRRAPEHVRESQFGGATHEPLEFGLGHNDDRWFTTHTDVLGPKFKSPSG